MILIKDLPKDIKELALNRIRYDGTLDNTDDTELSDAFSWYPTPEGLSFWGDINVHNFDIYKEKYPNHEWIKDCPGKYQIVEDGYGNNILVKVGDNVYPPFDKLASVGAKLHEEKMKELTTTAAVLVNGYYAGEDQPQEIKDAWTEGYEYALKNINLSDVMYTSYEDTPKGTFDMLYVSNDSTLVEDTKGIKETDGKVSYEEIDFEFIELMAANMSKNKDKYLPFNWQKKVNKADLISAMLRHIRKLKHPRPEDPESAEQHLASIGCDAMMLWYQYKNYGE